MRNGKRRASKTAHLDLPSLMAAAAVSSSDQQALYAPSVASRDLLRQLDHAQKMKLEGRAVAGDAAARRRAPASAPPLANRGGKVETVKLVLEDGKIKEVPKRRGYGGDCAMIDWLNFTVGIETFDHDSCAIGDETIVDKKERKPITLDDYSICISRRLRQILGYGISHSLGFGQHFYQSTYELSNGWGRVSLGGQRDTVLVSISGEGLAAAAEGWEARLKQFLDDSIRSRITRVDIAHDDYQGERYTVDQADADHTNGLFKTGGRNPDCEYRGNWKTPNGKGRTFNVGNRKNGKFSRIYEKGKQLGDENSPWVRIEVEFKSIDRVIPFDVLIKPGEYLAAAYPAFAFINTVQQRIITTQKATEASVDKAVKWLRHQCGNHIKHLVDIFGAESLIQKISRDDKLPSFMKIPHFGLAEKSIDLIVRLHQPVNLHAAASAW